MHMEKRILIVSVFLTGFFLSAPILAQQSTADQSPGSLSGVSDTLKIQAMPEPAMLPDVQKLRKIHPEKILFTHYKLSQKTPDFEHFAKTSPVVEKAQEIDKAAMTYSEYNRIYNAFHLHDEKEPFVIHTKLGVNQYSSLQDLIVFDELHEKTYFRIAFYGEDIAIVPKDIVNFSHIKISKPRANNMFKALSGSKALQAEFLLKPVYADRREPFVHDDKSYWLMLAELAEIRLWASDELVWFYRSESYQPEDKSNLKDLYTEP